MAVERGLRPVLAGRNSTKISAQAAELGLEHRIFSLDDTRAMDEALGDVAAVLHCAGPFIHTYAQMAQGCLRTGTHYLDLTGELPVYEALAAFDAEAKARGVMLLPGAGFDVVPTDCLAVHLKQRLSTATRLTLAFQAVGPANIPPGTQRTVIELIPYGNRVRRNGRIEMADSAVKTRLIDFGRGPVQATRLTWGDVFTAYFSTGIPNIENYAALPGRLRPLMAAMDYLQPILKLGAVRKLLKLGVTAGSTAEERARTFTHVWGEVADDQGRKAAARLHGPEAGVEWTAQTALAAVQKVMTGDAPPGFQTPALAYGADFVLEGEGVTREDVN
jgi:short subunit dehydrogenase-like uncharacterized protein